MNICNTDNLQIEMSVMLLKMADGSPPAEVKILTDLDILQKELSVMTVTSERWMERFVMNPQVLCLDGLTSDYDAEDRCSDVDGEEGIFQDPMPEVVSVRPEVTEKWMDRFVVDLVESPSVSMKGAVARTFGPAVSEEYSPVVFAGRAVADAYPLVVVVSDSALVSGLRPVVSDPALSGTARVSVPPVAGYEFPAALLGKVAFDAVGLGVGPPCFRVDSEDALLKQTDERALLARAAPGVILEMKLVHNSDGSTTKNIECVFPTYMLLVMNCPQLKLTPGEDDTSYRDTLDKIHETMCRAIVHKIDGSTTRNTGYVFTTNRLLATNYPRLKMTPGEYDASYGGTRIGGDLHIQWLFRTATLEERMRTFSAAPPYVLRLIFRRA